MALSIVCCTTSILSCIDYLLQPRCVSFRHPRDISNRLTCTLFQFYIVVYCIWNLLTIVSTEKKNAYHHDIHPFTRMAEQRLIGYFLYDTLVLLSTERGRRNATYLIHHAISVLILAINSFYPCGTDALHNSIIVLLEGSSPFLNLWKVSYNINPLSFDTYLLHRIASMLYYVFRIVGMTMWLFVYGTGYFRFTWNHLITMGGFGTIYMASLHWFRQLVKKQ